MITREYLIEKINMIEQKIMNEVSQEMQMIDRNLLLEQAMNTVKESIATEKRIKYLSEIAIYQEMLAAIPEPTTSTEEEPLV